MRFLNYLPMLLITFFLAACGGGGGAPGLPSGTVKPMTTTAPATLVLAVGSSQSFKVISGVFPVNGITSSNAQVATAALDGDNFWIGASSSGTSNIVITDAKGQAVTISVTVENLSKLYTTAPNSLVIQPGSAAVSYTIGGGQSPYMAVSDNPDVAVVDGSSGTVLKISPKKVGTANITASDSATPTKASVSIAVTVQSLVALTVSPTTASSFINMPVTVYLNGGTPPYSVGGSIPQAVSVVQDKSDITKFVVTPLAVSSGLDITFLDSTGANVKFTVTGIAGQPTIRMSPSTLTISETGAPPISLTVYGAPGLGNVFSSDLTLVTVPIGPVDFSNPFTVTPTRLCVSGTKTVTITAIDKNQSVATSVITITDNGNTTEILTTDNTTTPPTITITRAASNCPLP